MKLWQHGKSSSCPVREEALSVAHDWYFCNSHHWSCTSASTIVYMHIVYDSNCVGSLVTYKCQAALLLGAARDKCHDGPPGMSLQCCWQTNTHRARTQRKEGKAPCMLLLSQPPNSLTTAAQEGPALQHIRCKKQNKPKQSPFLFQLLHYPWRQRSRRSECNPCYSIHIYLYSKAEVI